MKYKNTKSAKNPLKLGIILVTGLMLFSTLSSNGLAQFSILRNIFLILNLFVFLFLEVILKKKIKVKISFIEILWFILAILIMISIGVNGSDIFFGLIILVLVPILYFVIIPDIFQSNLLKIISYSMAFSNGFIIIYSLMKYSVKYPYMGMLKNENSMGTVILAEIISIVILFISEKENRGRNKLGILYTIVLFLLFLLLIITGSRTSLITTIIVLLTLLVNSKIRTKISFKKIIISMLIVSCMCYIFFSNIEIIDPIMNKNNSPDSFVIRLNIWTNTIKESSLFGFGEDYFYNNFFHQSHSSYIDVLGKFGIFAFLIYLLICVFSFLNCFKYRKRYRDIDEFSYAPIIINLAYLVCSLTETLFSPIGNSLAISWVLVIAYTSDRNKFKRKKTKIYI